MLPAAKSPQGGLIILVKIGNGKVHVRLLLRGKC